MILCHGSRAAQCFIGEKRARNSRRSRLRIDKVERGFSEVERFQSLITRVSFLIVFGVESNWNWSG